MPLLLFLYGRVGVGCHRSLCDHTKQSSKDFSDELMSNAIVPIMSIHSSSLSIAPASISEKPIVERLLQLYLHDFSEFAEANDPFGNTDECGVFQYAHLESYWQKSERQALLFRANDHLAGFALINDWSASGRGTDKSIAEFFVLRKYRRIGLGTRAAVEIIESRPAAWEIAVAEYNQPALMFWRMVAASLDGYVYEEIAGDGHRWCGSILRLAPAPSEKS